MTGLRVRLRTLRRRQRTALAVATVGALAVGGYVGTVSLTGSSAAETACVVTAAGDINSGTNSSSAKATGDLVRAINPTHALTLGDNAYSDGTDSDFVGFNNSWGSFKAKTIPAPGNHEYHTNGDGYYRYWFGGARGGNEYRATEICNNWLVLQLNTEISVADGSAQDSWLRSKLASHVGWNIIATTHHPFLTSPSNHGPMNELRHFYDLLDGAGASLFLTGHNHNFERFNPWHAGGFASPGIVSITAGTGGAGRYSFSGASSGSAYRNDARFGVLKLTLHGNCYDREFVTTDAGSLDQASCVPARNGGPPPSTTSSSSGPSSTTSSTSSTSTSSTSSTTSSSTSSTTSTTRPGNGCASLPFQYGLQPWAFTFTSGTCATGGTAWSALPYATTSWETFHHTGGVTIKGPSNFTVKDTAVVNYGDGFRVEAGGQGFTFDHVYGAYLHDDGFENDWNQGGTIKNSHVESYVIFSARASAGQGGDGSKNTVTLSGNYLELKPTPTTYKGAPNLSGPWFKLDANSPQLVATNNVFVATTVPPFGTLDAPAFKSCSGNVVIWRGAGAFPGRASWAKQCPDTTFLTTP